MNVQDGCFSLSSNGWGRMDGCMFRRFSQAYSCSPSIALNLFTFFSLGILKVPWDSLVSISRLWISMSLFLTGTLRQTSHRKPRKICHTVACRGRQDRLCSWQRHQAWLQPFRGQLQEHPSWSLQENWLSYSCLQR